ncbi:Rv3654c family TadE-like protein [Streptosporangium sp. 'caverna']|uniref:Rv3654c family TadE-like protein n=1 Tax=Streptosporangium sp. 'caverna' TaxID=2202249 RepID=UPI0035176A0E
MRGRRCHREAGRRLGREQSGHRKQAGHRNGADTERGSATIWMVGLMALIFAMASAVAFTGMARVARHRAQSAADLSALAAARLAFADPNRGCAEASSLAVGNGAKVTRCSIDGDGIADIQVALRLLLPVAGGVTVMADARAGPVHISDFAD